MQKRRCGRKPGHWLGKVIDVIVFREVQGQSAGVCEYYYSPCQEFGGSAVSTAYLWLGYRPPHATPTPGNMRGTCRERTESSPHVGLKYFLLNTHKDGSIELMTESWPTRLQLLSENIRIHSLALSVAPYKY